MQKGSQYDRLTKDGQIRHWQRLDRVIADNRLHKFLFDLIGDLTVKINVINGTRLIHFKSAAQLLCQKEC